MQRPILVLYPQSKQRMYEFEEVYLSNYGGAATHARHHLGRECPEEGPDYGTAGVLSNG